MHLQGRVAVVTGAASGIGFALADRLGSEGMALVIADVEVGALDEAAARLRSSGHEVDSVPTDVTDGDQVDALAARALDRFGGVHLVCNNAGVATVGPAWEQSVADWTWVLAVDLWGVIHGVRTFVPILLAGGQPGHVVNTASIAGLVPSADLAPYNVAKAGVVALSETLHHDLQAIGAPVGVSVLCPGAVPTGIADSRRNRPGSLAAPRRARPAGQLPSTARSPAEIADRTVAAVRSDEFWVLTHEGSGALVADRAERITSGDRPIALPAI